MGVNLPIKFTLLIGLPSKDIYCWKDFLDNSKTDSARDEWHNKAAGIVSYRSTGGARAAEHLRGILGELLVADVRVNPTLCLFTDFENFKTFIPADLHLGTVHAMLDQTIAWSGALKKLR